MARFLAGLEKAIGRIESDRSPLVLWIASFLVIVLFRNFLEGALEYNKTITPVEDFLVAYPIFYALLLVNLVLLIRLITKADTAKIFKFLTVLFALILVVPIADFILSSGEGYSTSYVIGNPEYMAGNFLTYYGTAATPGQKAEGALFGTMLLLYVFIKTKSRIKAAAGLAASYLLLFLFAALPALLYYASIPFFGDVLNLGGAPGAVANPEIQTFSDYVTPVVWNTVMLLLIFAELALIILASDKRRFTRLVNSVRPLRIFHYLLLGGFGLALGYSIMGAGDFGIPEIFSSLALLFGIVFFYQYASLINDIFDKDMRLRVKSAKDLPDTGDMWVFAGVSLLFGLMLLSQLGYEAFVILTTVAVLSFLYSAPPFRLKRYTLISSLTLAMCSLLTVLAGFSVFCKDLTIVAFPPELLWLILIAYTLGTNYKDLKDVRLDRQNGIYTIPVLLGKKKGKIAVSLLVASSFLLVPAILGAPKLLPLSMTCALLSAVFIKADLPEAYFRLMHLGYFALVAFAILRFI